jgi:superfamily II DNA or RNA helicase
MPTGAGKSVVAREWVRRRVEEGKRGLVLAHRTELLKQFRDHLDAVGVHAGIISPDYQPDDYARVQIASMDTLVARGHVPDSQFVVVDETHHIVAATWQPIIESLPDAIVLGLTATPQRGDGRTLGDVFQALVVGAQYSELLKLGNICPVRIMRPERYLGSDWAVEPVEAWMQYAAGKRGFVFCRTVSEARELAKELTSRGVPAACVDGQMATAKRTDVMRRFKSGELEVLTNVFVLTEGVDVPAAEACMLARSPRHAGTYLQMVGRVLRPSSTKRNALLIDLPGCSHTDMHGNPTSDREYSLEGRAIKAVGESLKNCPKCGLTMPSAVRVCEECGHEWERRVRQGPKIWNLELLEYFENGGEIEDAPKDMRRGEWDRLLTVCRTKSFGVSFAIKEYGRLFEEPPPQAWIKDIEEDERLAELKRLRRIQDTRGLKVGWISHAYKSTFGAFPSRALREKAGIPLLKGRWG